MRSRPLMVACALTAALVLAAALAMSVTLAPPPARADGDPASDVLLGQNVFYPYQPPVSPSLQKQLNAATSAAAKAHFPLKVALIAAPVDLGVIPQMFGKPQQYARFLDQEISYPSPQPLLVVMAAGYGAAGLSPPAQDAVASLRAPAGPSSNSLAEAAITAVRTVARAAGHPLPASTGSGGSGATAFVAGGVALAALWIAAAVIAVRRIRPARIRAETRRRRTRGTAR